jgi:hypothetical protein
LETPLLSSNQPRTLIVPFTADSADGESMNPIGCRGLLFASTIPLLKIINIVKMLANSKYLFTFLIMSIHLQNIL